MKEYEFKQVILNETSSNLFAIALTPWHANGIDVCLKCMENQGIKANAVIYIKHHKISGRCITPSNFKMRNERVRFQDIGTLNRPIINQALEYLEIIPKVFGKGKCKDRAYVVCFDEVDFLWLAYLKNKDVIFYFADDGTSDYESTKYLNFARNKRIHGVLYAYLIASVMKIKKTIYDAYYATYFKKGNIVDLRLLKKDRCGKYIPNESAIELYREMAKKPTSSIVDKDLIDGKIIIAAVSLSENRMSDKNEDLEIMEELFGALKMQGLHDRIVIKPHPREMDVTKYDKYNCLIMNKDIGSLEDIIGNSSARPLCVISMFSSTAINLQLLFDVKTISLSRILLTKPIDNTLRKIVEGFIKMAEGIVDMPNTISEVCEIIKN